MHHRASIWLLALCLPAAMPAAAEEDSGVESREAMMPTCELIGLVSHPPEGWSNDPMDFSDPGLAGCEMVRTGGHDESLGFVRLLSVVVPEGVPQEKWLSGLLDLEAEWLQESGITMGETLFMREDVPISGLGDFENGTGLGLEARIEGSDTPREIHFLGFNSPTIQYLLTLLTPAREVGGGLDYERNTDDFGLLLRSFQLPEGD